MRKYSIPFPLLQSGESVDDFISFFSNYKDSIDNVYLGITDVSQGHHDYNCECMLVENVRSFVSPDYDKMAYEFLQKSKGIFKRLITINCGFYPATINQIVGYVTDIIIPFADKYEIEGFICTDYNMACLIHEARPNIDIQTSCNGFIWTKREMDLWNQNAGTTTFNPPREFLRMPNQLKLMRETGYKLKYLVNESCTFGCPQRITDVMHQAIHLPGFGNFCAYENFLKGVFILPRWQKELDEYVDIYKLAGRVNSFKKLKDSFLAYYNEADDVNLQAILTGGGGKFRDFLTTEVPDKLLYCECKDCKACGICDSILANKINETNS